MTDPRDTPRLFSLQRRERLMDELRSHGSVGVREIAALLGVSELTIRRDINALALQGLVTRVHGGATLRSTFERSLGAKVSPREGAAIRYNIGMMAPSLDYYWPQVINGARAAAIEAQSRIVLRGSTYGAQDNRKQIQALLDTTGIHGLIVAPELAGKSGVDMLRWLDNLPVPVVLAERQISDGAATQRLESVATDHAFGAGLAVRHLYAAGHKRIGLLASPTSPTSRYIRRGWGETLEAIGLADGDLLDSDAVGFNSDDREKVMDGILEDCRSKGVTALLIHSDPQAIAFEQHCVDRGIAIPGDLALVAYDDEVAHLGLPAITAVRPPKHYVGRIAVELLLARLEEGRKRPIHHIQVNPELIIRESSVEHRSPSEVDFTKA